ncbi:hypothetical protein [Vreelandella olivaria]|uniref:hypothetical protein n=1 Tax=Vreelandella olivaria TaxID=390919 RepID=UPI00201EECB2|nr:hypothetical protein [Halomonas olivaria]
MSLKTLLQRTTQAAKAAGKRVAPAAQNNDGWTDGWHTQATSTESLRMLRDSATDAAKSTAQTVTTQAAKAITPAPQTNDGWTDGWHTQATPTESLRMLRDSATDAAKATAETATTQEGWQRVGRGAGKVIAGGATVAVVVIHGMLQAAAETSHEEEEEENLSDGWRNGHSGYGYYFGDWRTDDEDY